MELTAEEKAEARKRAVEQYQQAEFRKMQERGKKPTAKQENNVQPSLFNF